MILKYPSETKKSPLSKTDLFFICLFEREPRLVPTSVKMRALSRLFWKHHHKMLRAMRLCKDSTISIRYPK